MRTVSRFAGKTVVVTGGTGALGEAVVAAFLREGATVSVWARSAQKMEALRGRMGEGAERLDLRPMNLLDEAAIREVAAAVAEKLGGPDGLVNAVGGFFGGVPVVEMSLEQWERMQQLNVMTVLNATRAVLPYLLEQGRGFVVNVGSRAGLSGAPGMSAYCASKAAVKVLTESLAAEVADQGVRANCVLPSIIDTPANRRAMPDADHSRWVAPAAIAEVILFLASDEAEAISGAAVPVYGRA